MQDVLRAFSEVSRVGKVTFPNLLEKLLPEIAIEVEFCLQSDSIGAFLVATR